MNNIRFRDFYLNSVLMTLIDPSQVLVFHTTFKNSRVIINLHSFVESQCRCNILTKYLGIRRDLFDTGRKFMHSIVEETDYHTITGTQKEFKELYTTFIEKVSFLNLLMVSQCDSEIEFAGTLPMCVVAFVDKHKTRMNNTSACIPVSEFITTVDSTDEVYNYLKSNPTELELVLQYIMKYSGNLKYLIDYRKVVDLFMQGTSSLTRESLIDLYFCMHKECIWRSMYVSHLR